MPVGGDKYNLTVRGKPVWGRIQERGFSNKLYT